MSSRRFEHSSNPGFSCSESVILLPFGRRSYLPAIVERAAGERIEVDETTDREVYTLQAAGTAVTLVYSGMGGPAAANALEMVNANGARRVAVLGACGGVSPELGVGHLLVVNAAVRGEGTSRYYAPPELPACFDPALVMALAGECRRSAEVPVHRGVVYTTDASYRQGPEVYEQYRGLIVGVECECATVAVVAARLGLSAAALLFCTDNVTAPKDQDQHYRGLRDSRVETAFDQALTAVLSVLTSQ